MTSRVQQFILYTCEDDLVLPDSYEVANAKKAEQERLLKQRNAANKINNSYKIQRRPKRRKVNYTCAQRQDKNLSRIFIDKGRKIRIKTLQKEIDDLDLKIKVASGKLNAREMDYLYREIEHNLKLQEELAEKIKKAKLEIGHIKSQIERLDRKNVELDQEKEAEVPFFEHFKRANRQLEIHENRLYVSKQYEDRVTIENRRLFEILSKMLYFRSIFNKRWNEIVHKLKDRKKFLFDMIENTSAAFNEESELIETHKNVQRIRDRNKESDISDFLTMKRRIDANDIISLFLQQKGKRRPFPPISDIEVERRNNVKTNYNDRLNLYHNIIEELLKMKVGPKVNCPIEKVGYFKYYENESFQFGQYQQALKERLHIVSSMLVKQTKEAEKIVFDVKKLKSFYADKIKVKEKELQDEINKTMKFKMECDDLNRDIRKNSEIFFKTAEKLRCDLSQAEKHHGKQTILDNYTAEGYFSVLERRLHELIAYVYWQQRGIDNKFDVGPQYTVRKANKPYQPLVKAYEIIKTNQCPECVIINEVKAIKEDKYATVMTDEEVMQAYLQKIEEQKVERHLHTLSECQLPQSSIIASRRHAD